MNCKICGAYIRADDRFCSKCGAPTELAEKTDPDRQKKLYDDKVFRDSFLDKNEEGHHALLVTLTVLLAVAVLAISAVFYIFVLSQKHNPEGNLIQTVTIEAETSGEPQTQEEELIPFTELTEETQTQAATETQTENEIQTETAQTAGPDMEQVEQLMTGSDVTATDWAVYVYELGSNQEYTAGSCDTAMYTSACITVPILYATAILLDQGAIHLTDQIVYVNSVGGRGEPEPEKRDGQSLELSYYLTTMLQYSDNNCINCLIDYLGLENINRICQGEGFESVDLQRKIVAEVTDGTENYVSARDLGLMVKELYNGKSQTLGREFMRSAFKIDETDANYTVLGLAPEIPEGTLFLNQNGKGDTRYSEAAVVSDDIHSYVISVMLMGEPGFTYEDAVIKVSGYIFNQLCEGGNQQ